MRILVTMLKGVLCVGAIFLCLRAAPAQAQIQIVIGPPAVFRATATPVYFEGRATYWYGGRWYYRDGGNWGYYDNEPAHLRGYREHREPVRHFYGRAHEGGYRRR